MAGRGNPLMHLMSVFSIATLRVMMNDKSRSRHYRNAAYAELLTRRRKK